jgi:PAS domain S-box-containing protein
MTENRSHPALVRSATGMANPLQGSVESGTDAAARDRIEESLRESEERFRRAMDFSAIGMALVAPEGHFLDVNRSLCRIVGYSREELRTRTFQDITHPDDLDADLELVRSMLAGEIESYHLEKRYLHKDGRALWVLLSVSLVHDAQGRPAYFVSQIQDISTRKEAERQLAAFQEELEARVRERTADLEDANRELESFCYTVSHDLRAPLRHINGYATMLAEQCAGTDLPGVPRTTRALQNASRQMGLLIDSLLEFARKGREAMREEFVDLDELVSAVVTSLWSSASDRPVEWNIDRLPPVVGDPTMLGQVFTNLLDNALKYTNRVEVPRIEVAACDDNGDHVVLVVRDNGAGFDMEHAGRLFGMFHRLHRSDEFPGNGVGLAIVQRIVARHGGRIWAEASPGRGAAFHFTLRKASPVAGTSAFSNAVGGVVRGEEGVSGEAAPRGDVRGSGSVAGDDANDAAGRHPRES